MTTQVKQSRISAVARVAAVLVGASILPGCAALDQKKSQVVYREPGDRRLGSPQPVKPRAQEDLYFAWLSDAAYRKTPAGADDAASAATSTSSPMTVSTQPGSDAAAPNPSADPSRAIVSCPDSEKALKDAGWEQWENFPNDGLQTQIGKYHLRIEVWTRSDPATVVVAFGGTVFRNRNDWRSNLRWFTPKWILANHPDEYSATVQTFAPAFQDEFKARLESGDPKWAFLKKAVIYATGHSLGGGLAQQFAYALPQDSQVPRVHKVYAFDPSPVTGYYSVDKELRESNQKDLLIDRIYERGEILAIVRSFTSFFVAPSGSQPTIRGIRYALFYPANPVHGHSMSDLACKIYAASL